MRTLLTEGQQLLITFRYRRMVPIDDFPAREWQTQAGPIEDSLGEQRSSHCLTTRKAAPIADP